jgi:hypothetical protein
LHKKNKFRILKNIPVKLSNDIPQNQFAKKFRNLSEEDMLTSGTYMLSIKE